MNETYMTGRLFDDHLVTIDARSAIVGGSWHAGSVDGIQRAWDMKMIELFHSFMFDGCHIVDVGASTGSFALLPAIVPNARVTAFEPNPAITNVLGNNIRVNSLAHRAVIYELALHDCADKLLLKVPQQRNQSGLACVGTPLRYNEWTPIVVQAVAMDSINWKQPIDVLKIDTEGDELFVLKGGEETIRRDKPVILCEYNPTNCQQLGYEHTKIRELLESWGAETYPRGTEDLLTLWPGETNDR